MKVCSKCGEEKPPEAFYRRVRQCKPCVLSRKRKYYAATRQERIATSRKWQRVNAERYGARHHLRHGVSKTEYEAMLVAQGGACAVCGARSNYQGRRLCIDHDHRCCSGASSCSGCTRGLLCIKCNAMIGLALDNPEVLRLAADYLLDRRRKESVA